MKVVLKMGNDTVYIDVVYLNKQAQDNLKTHVQEKLLVQYQKRMAGLQQVLKITWHIVNSDSSTAANKLQALALISDSYKYLMDLMTNGVVVTDAIKYVQGKMDHLNKTEKELLRDIKQKEEGSSGESLQDEETTNGVF